MIPRRKKEKIFLLVVLAFTVCVLVWESVRSIRANAGQNGMNTLFGANRKSDSGEYTFSKVEDEEKIWGTSKICNIYEPFEYEKSPLAYGQMLTLFGEPLYLTNDLESQYEYVISAADKEGKITYLTVYSGPSGPAIGGTKDGQEAAAELLCYIRSAGAADYDYTGYYMDIPCRVEMGVKDDKPYYYTEVLDLSDEEILALYESLGTLN